jgi:hypothetical protein
MKSKKNRGFDQKPESPGDINIDLQTGDEDDDIIDLEDIIEMPARPINEEEDIDMDVEILDAEPELTLDSSEKPAKAAPQPPAKNDVLDFGTDEPERDEELLLDDFNPDDDEDLFGRIEVTEHERPAAEGEQVFGDDEAMLMDDLPSKDAKPEVQLSEENQHALRERAAAALKIEDETARGIEPEPAPEAVIEPESPEAPEAEPPKPAPDIAAAATAAASAAVSSGQAAAQPAASSGGVDEFMIAELVEELVGRIESRLMDTVRSVVEARLPEIARDVIREEIERVKKEIESS